MGTLTVQLVCGVRVFAVLERGCRPFVEATQHVTFKWNANTRVGLSAEKRSERRRSRPHAWLGTDAGSGWQGLHSGRGGLTHARKAVPRDGADLGVAIEWDCPAGAPSPLREPQKRGRRVTGNSERPQGRETAKERVAFPRLGANQPTDRQTDGQATRGFQRTGFPARL